MTRRYPPQGAGAEGPERRTAMMAVPPGLPMGAAGGTAQLAGGKELGVLRVLFTCPPV